MINEDTCMICKRPLVHDEIALTRKLINRGASEFMCMTCLAAKFNVSESLLEEKIEHFKKQGCTLFFI